jgi:DnaK suppressor protein
MVTAAVRPDGPKPLRIRAKAVPPSTRVSAYSGPPIDLVVVLAKLQAKKQEILAMYLNDLRSGQESNDSPTEDIVDRANNAYSRELNFSISDAERALMLQVDEAIRRVENGSYASCANCGNPIARPRLEAVPWARYCIACQELLEQGMLSES